MASWSFLTNHALTLLCIAHDPGVRFRDIAVEVGITERRAHGIVADLVGLADGTSTTASDPARLFPEYLAAVEQLSRVVDAWRD